MLNRTWYQPQLVATMLFISPLQYHCVMHRLLGLIVLSCQKLIFHSRRLINSLSEMRAMYWWSCCVLVTTPLTGCSGYGGGRANCLTTSAWPALPITRWLDCYECFPPTFRTHSTGTRRDWSIFSVSGISATLYQLLSDQVETVSMHASYSESSMWCY